MNLPNKLTVSRFVLTVVFLVALFWPWHIPFRNSFALVFFCLAGVTDFLDGRIARSRNLITNFGILMDPLADKIMTCSAFIAFVESTRLHADAPVKVGAWMVIVIVARELAITGLRLLAASKNIVLAAERYGKHPALLLWHVSNEYGGECHCPLCQEAFRLWLRRRYGAAPLP